MVEREETRNDMLQRMQPSFATSSSSRMVNSFDVPHLNTSQIHAPGRQFSPNLGSENIKRPGIPPSHPHIPPLSPYSQIPVTRTSPGSQNFSPGRSHSRSLSQPAFFNLDLPPLSPSPYKEPLPSSMSDTVSVDVSMGNQDGNLYAPSPASFTRGNSVMGSDSLPPRKAHRRSNSDVPFGFSTIIQSSPPLLPPKGQCGVLNRSSSLRENSGTGKPIHLVKREAEWDTNGDSNTEGMGDKKSEGEVIDDLFSAYMNLDNLEALNSGPENKHENRDDLDSMISGSKTNGADSSENEAESSVNESANSMPHANLTPSGEKRDGNKRSAEGDIAPSNRHCRSVSMDSFMGGTPPLGDESSKLPPLSPGTRPVRHSQSNSFDDSSSSFNLDFGNGEFSAAEMKKIMENEKLSGMALADPKRVKRILANRQSAARSKERRMRYILELEHKVQTLQTEATTLSTQLTLLQRDATDITSENNELKFRLQAMEQQALLRDALNEALTAEVQRLRIAATEFGEELLNSNCMAQQLPMNPQMFQMQHQQLAKLSMYQMQQRQTPPPPPPPQPQQQNTNKATKPEPDT